MVNVIQVDLIGSRHPHGIRNRIADNGEEKGLSLSWRKFFRISYVGICVSMGENYGGRDLGLRSGPSRG